MRERHKIEFDKKRAQEIFSRIDKEWQKGPNSNIYKDLILPQNKYKPDLGGKELALFFFYAVLGQRGSIISEQPMKIWLLFRKKMPEAFEPVIAATLSPKEILKGLKRTIYDSQKDKKKTGRGFKLTELSEHWVYNSTELIKNWNGDPRNIFLGANDFMSAYERIKRKAGKTSFRGFGMKIFALYNIYLQERGVLPHFHSPLPVDFHTMRILWATEIIKKIDWAKIHTPTKRQPPMLDGKQVVSVYYDIPNMIAAWSQKFMTENGFSHLDMNPALWLLSRNFCSKCFQNTSRKKGMEYVDEKELKNHPAMWPKNYKDPCVNCPIESYCKWSIPSAPYWKWGLLVRIGRRVPYPKNRKKNS